MVCIVTLILWVGCGWCWFLARGEPGDVLHKISSFLYHKYNALGLGRKGMYPGGKDLGAVLTCLHPGEPVSGLLAAYYISKIRLTLLVLLIGSGLACAVRFSGEASKVAVQQGVVHRGEEKETVILEALVKDGVGVIREKIPLDIHKRKVNEAEAKAMYALFLQELEQLLLGQNPSMDEICQNLYLPAEVEGYPFDIDWTSSDYSLVAYDGSVSTDTLDEPTEVELRARITCGYLEWKHSWFLTLQPPVRSEREQLVYDLKKAGQQAEAEASHEESFTLPSLVEGQQVTWSQARDRPEGRILLVALVAAIAVYHMKDRDLEEELTRRRACMKMEYPIVVSKFALLLGAGMTVRGAFQKICSDYREGTSQKHPLYEEMQYSCNELQAGVSEAGVYENFGRRTGIQEYTRLCTLLNQNLKKGNGALVARLGEEYQESLRESANLRKRQGEEAGTRLLAPMGMLLVLVLLMVMLPAFSGLGI